MIRSSTISLAVTLAITSPSFAQTPVASPPSVAAPAGLEGRWTGAIDLSSVAEGALRVEINVKSGPDGIKATFTSIDQGNAVFPITNLTREGQVVKGVLPEVGGSFTGALSSDGRTLTARWVQGGVELPMSIARQP